jgi:hypothetical protein
LAARDDWETAGKAKPVNDFITLPQVDREYLIRKTAERKNIPPLIIEKDYWLVWVLAQLFSLELSDYLHFRGGTSLSKVYRLIDRFSEDIDLSLDRKYFDFDDRQLFACINVSQQDKLLKNLNRKNREYLKSILIKELETLFNAILPPYTWSLEFQQDSRQYGIIFKYPQSLPENTYSELYYLKPGIKVEIYSNQDNDPWQKESISAELSEHFPDEISKVETNLKVVSLGRTFWEKALLIHSYLERGTFSGDRFSRHLYDLFCITHSNHFEEIVNDRQLLEKTIAHREIFYRQASVNYQKAMNGELNLIPRGKLLDSVHSDYKKMDTMIYGPSPDFFQIIEKISEIQQRVNEE